MQVHDELSLPRVHQHGMAVAQTTPIHQTAPHAQFHVVASCFTRVSRAFATLMWRKQRKYAEFPFRNTKNHAHPLATKRANLVSPWYGGQKQTQKLHKFIRLSVFTVNMQGWIP